MKKWIKCIGAILCVGVVSTVSHFLANLIPQGNIGDTEYGVLVYFFASFLMAIGLITIICLFGRKDILTSAPKGSFKKGCVLGSVLIGYGIYFLISNLVSCIRDQGTPAMPPIFIIIYIVGLFLGAGIGEEFIFRGIFMNFIRRAAGEDTRKGLIIGMAVSSFFFGLVHLANLQGNPDVIGTLGQVVYAMGVGFYLAAIYARTKNIWFNVLLHLFIDVAALLKTMFVNNEVSISEVIGGSPLMVIMRSLLIFAVFLGMGLFYIRKSKMPELN